MAANSVWILMAIMRGVTRKFDYSYLRCFNSNNDNTNLSSRSIKERRIDRME